jgi:hypothetical protein
MFHTMTIPEKKGTIHSSTADDEPDVRSSQRADFPDDTSINLFMQIVAAPGKLSRPSGAG